MAFDITFMLFAIFIVLAAIWALVAASYSRKRSK